MTKIEPKPRVADRRAYWTHEVESYPHPVAQFRMAQLVDYDPRLTEPARIVYRFLVGWYMHGHGDALASVRQIVAAMRGRAPNGARELSRSAVQRAIILLIDNSWLTRKELGKGRRGSRYVPVANVLELAAMGKLPGSVPVEGDTTEEFSVPEKWDTCVPEKRDATPDSVPPVGTKTRIPDPRTDAGTGIVNSVSATPGIGAGGAMPADGFGEIWKAYGRHGNKTKARAAWEAIDWSQYDYGPEHVVERARSWAGSAKPGQRRMPLEKWIAAEKFDEADRAVEPRPKASLSSGDSEPSDNGYQIPTPANDNNPAPRLVTITSSRKEETERSRAAIFNAVAEDGETIEIYISYEHQWQWAQEAGQQNLVELARAVGIEAFEDTEAFHDIPFLLGQNESGGHTYLPAPSRAKETSHA